MVGNSTAGGSETGSNAVAASGDRVIMVDASPSPHAEILAAAKGVLKVESYELKVIRCTDYVQPSPALESRSLGVNYFQRLSCPENLNKERGTRLVSMTAIRYEPSGTYADKPKDPKNVQDGAKIVAPDGMTNEAGALLLPADQGLIGLKSSTDINATEQDIAENPYKIEVVGVEAAQAPCSLPSVDFGAISGNFVITVGLKVSDVLVTEPADSVTAKACMNVIAVREGDESSDRARVLIRTLTTAGIKWLIGSRYQGAVIPILW